MTSNCDLTKSAHQIENDHHLPLNDETPHEYFLRTPLLSCVRMFFVTAMRVGVKTFNHGSATFP